MKFKNYINVNEKIYVPGINEVSVGSCIVYMMNSISQFHIWHLLAKSGQKHTALNELYTGLQDELDDLAEIFIAGGGILQPVEISLITEYNDDSIRSEYAMLRNKLSQAISETSAPDMRSIQHELIEIQELVNKSMYKFDLE